jgi:hypothetical protein
MKLKLSIISCSVLLIIVACEKRIIPRKVTACGYLEEIPPFSVPDSVLHGANARLTDGGNNTTYYLSYDLNFTHPLYKKSVVVYGKTRNGYLYNGIVILEEVDSVRAK